MHGKLPIRIVLALFVLSLIGCVSQKQYNELLDSKARTDRENLRLQQVEKDYNEQSRQLSQTLSSLGNTEDILGDYKSETERLTSELEELQESYDNLQSDYSNLTETSSREKGDLKDRLERTRRDLNSKKDALNQVTILLAEDPGLRRQLLLKVDQELQAQRLHMDSIKSVFETNLDGLPREALIIHQDDRDLYILLASRQLFADSSSNMSFEGEQLFAQITPTLIQVDDITVRTGGLSTELEVEEIEDLAADRVKAVHEEILKSGIDKSSVTLLTPENDPGQSRIRGLKIDDGIKIILSPQLMDIIEILESIETNN